MKQRFILVLAGSVMLFGVKLPASVEVAPPLTVASGPEPISTLPELERFAQTETLTGHQFDSGSGIVLSDLTRLQIDNICTLGKVWGFLKYYAPQVTAGTIQWDFQLFRVLPSVISARNSLEADSAMSTWINGINSAGLDAGHPGPNEEDPHLLPDFESRPDLSWIHDKRLLGYDLSKQLQPLEQARRTGNQFYVSLNPAGNPSFENELTYPDIKFPDSGYQILSLFRFWNIVEYWDPYRDVMGEDWNQVLWKFLPRIALANNFEDFQRQFMALVGQTHDTHANLWSSLNVRPPVGNCSIPVTIRFIQGFATVVRVDSEAKGYSSWFKAGDVLIELGGKSVEELIDAWTQFYADSNEAARMRDIANNMTNGPCGRVSVKIRRGSSAIVRQADRIPTAPVSQHAMTHDLPGDTFRLLCDQVAYIKLSSIRAGDIDHYLRLAARTRGLIVDIRNYPSDFVVFALGSHFVKRQTPFAKFTRDDLAYPGAFVWGNTMSIDPAEPFYAGKVVILEDELTQSSAEFAVMALRSSPNAMVIGSTTAGADGNVSKIPLPGGLSAMISGIGVFYPNGAPTQRIGIVPDRYVTPTIQGIRDGHDEVLEEAIREITGSGPEGRPLGNKNPQCPEE